jgi:hypothetical protein
MPQQFHIEVGIVANDVLSAQNESYDFGNLGEDGLMKNVVVGNLVNIHYHFTHWFVGFQ